MERWQCGPAFCGAVWQLVLGQLMQVEKQEQPEVEQMQLPLLEQPLLLEQQQCPKPG